MGILDFVKAGVQEMLIHRPDDKKDLIVYKHPEETIPHYSQLTVDADEGAVFFRDGSVVGTLRTAGAGQRHTLSSQNIPFLGQIVDKVTGGNIFLTDLFFVTMKPVYNQRFGGELGYIEDPMLGEMVTPRIFGEFAFQIFDPQAFIVNYVGVRAPEGNEQVTRWLVGKFMNSVKTIVGEFCVSEQKSMLQLMPLQNQLAQVFVERCPDLNSIGVRIVDVGQFNINLSEEDEETLKTAQAEIGKAKRAARIANIGIAEAQAQAAQKQFELDQNFQNDARYVQGLAGGNFGQYAAGKAMMGAGEGMAQGGGEGGGAGGGMMAGAGLGAGFGMAQAFSGAFQQGGAPQAAPPAAPVPVAAAPGATITCGSCNATVPGGRFCAGCGAALAPQPRFCPSCGTQGVAGSKFCANCGTGFPS
ncbi:MAG: SPFH domain-containing protein [Myxococcales bacterium]|nr:SPFH domain-containing protein [Myxococcales bacterium]